MTVERFLQALRLMEQQGQAVSKAATTAEMTPRRAVGLMLRRRETLSEEERLALTQVCQLHPHINRAHTLIQQFVQMVRSLKARGTRDLDACRFSQWASRTAFLCQQTAPGSSHCAGRPHPQMEQWDGGGTYQSLKISQAQHVWPSQF
jgi:hypothetical protein